MSSLRNASAALALAALGAGLLTGQESVPPPVTGKASPDLAGFDTLMTSFLGKHDLPGAALAIGRKGKVVYARGFGYADKHRKQPVQPDSLFRIASISKPVTAVAVLQLVERGKLKLDDRAFALLDLKAPVKGFDPRWKQITVRQLLEHRGGWDRGKSFDPMFRSPAICAALEVAPPAMPDAIIRYMLTQKLDFEPGTREAYSNFGYCLLGRVVEKVAGAGYEAYVQNNVLAPVGAKAMRLGKSLTAFEGEVFYHGRRGRAVMGPALGQLVPLAYGGWCLEAMDAHGGWVASAPDLVRFGMAFDDPKTCPVLKPDSVAEMFAAPAGTAKKGSWYAKGWMVRTGGELRAQHTGSLEGTSTILVRRADGLTWAALFNTREKDPVKNLGLQVETTAAAVKRWPE